MHLKWIAVAIAASLGTSHLAVAATPAATIADAREVQQLKAELTALHARLEALEARADAQAGINAATGQTVRALQTAQTASDKTPTAADKLIANTSLSGKMYFDFTHIDARDSDTGRTEKSGIGLDVKRFYLGVNHSFDDVWSANLTTDFSYASGIGQTSLFVKKAYLQGKFADAAVLRIGSADLPWVPYVEGLYGYRYVENTLIDRLKYGTSADWGLHLSGDVGGKSLNYAVSAINGNGYKNPSRSNHVDTEARIGFTPLPGLVLAVGGYRGYRGQDTATVGVQHLAQRGDVMLAYASDAFRLGAEYFTARNWNTVQGARSDTADGYSLWASAPVADRVSVFARYDAASLSRQLDRHAKNTYYNAGVQFDIRKGFQLAAVYKHEQGDKAVDTPVPPHVRQVRSNEIGVFGQVAF